MNIDWDEAFTDLVSHGHTVEAIKGYTPYQIMSFFGNVQKKKVETMKTNIIANAVGSQDGKAINKYMKQLGE